MLNKQVTVLARRDHREGMRVAAGITIFEHEVNLVFMTRRVSDEDAECEEAELLELVEIDPQTTVAEMREHMRVLTAAELNQLIHRSDMVVNV